MDEEADKGTVFSRSTSGKQVRGRGRIKYVACAAVWWWALA